MYKANLSFAQLNDYLRFMLKTGVLNKFIAKGKDVYMATEKGIDFLQRHCELTDLLKENGNGKNGVKIPPQRLLKKT
jgi:predicted transcriptional regulator